MIYLLRHGLDDESRIGGYSDVSLLDEGKKQVENAVKFMKDNNIDFDIIYSSDITRAIETSEIVIKEYPKNIIYTEKLRELDKGSLTGMLKEDAYAIYPDYNDLNDIYKSYPNGESMYLFYNRIIKLIDEFPDNSLLVTHRGFINMIYYYLTNTPLDMDKEKFGVTHASIHELNKKEKKIKKLY